MARILEKDDCILTLMNPPRNLLCHFGTFMTRLFGGSSASHAAHARRGRAISLLIGLYQRTLSPDHGPLRHLFPYGYCRHEPTCSQYMKQQVEMRGTIMGSLLGIRQMLSCHPWKKPSDEKILKFYDMRTAAAPQPGEELCGTRRSPAFAGRSRVKTIEKASQHHNE